MKTALVWVFGILGGLVGLILLLTAAILFLPTKLDLEYRDHRPRLRLRFLFLRFTLFPRKKKKPKRDKKPAPSSVSVPTEAVKQADVPTEPTAADETPRPAEKTQAVPPPPEKKADTEKSSGKHTSSAKTALKGFTFRDYVTILQTVAEEFLAKFRCEKLILHAAVGGEDAMKAAFAYAELHALLYPVCSALASSDKLKQADVQIDPDFTSETIRAEGRAVFSIRLYRSVGCVITLYKKLF